MANVIARRWSSRLSIVAPRSRRRAHDPDVVALGVDRRPERPEARDDAADPVGFLLPAAHRRRGSRSSRRPGLAARHRTGISSIAAATSAGPRSIARSSEVRTTRSADRLADAIVGGVRAAGRQLVDRRAHRSQQVDDRPPGRVEPDIAERQLGVRMRGARDEPERSSRHVPGYLLIDRSHVRHSLDTPGDGPRGRRISRLPSLHRHASRAQHPLGVIARRHRLADRRPPVGSQGGEQDGRLHLGTRDGCRRSRWTATPAGRSPSAVAPYRPRGRGARRPSRAVAR